MSPELVPTEMPQERRPLPLLHRQFVNHTQDSNTVERRLANAYEARRVNENGAGLPLTKLVQSHHIFE